MNDNKIIQSWRNNASPWISAVREQHIESRKAVTDRAIIEAVAEQAPTTVLDIGCGEGWLARALAARDMQVTGIDVVPELIDAARLAGDGEFSVLAYEALLTHPFEQSFDAIVCNFSLLGENSTDAVLRAVPSLLNPGGKLLVQTLHPVSACGDEPYHDGWRQGSWQGFKADLAERFTDPAPWYFRTLESWQALIADAGLTLVEMKEPSARREPSAGKEPSAHKEPSASKEPSADKEPRRSADSQPASVIFIARV